jgi:hypothetical protein
VAYGEAVDMMSDTPTVNDVSGVEQNILNNMDKINEMVLGGAGERELDTFAKSIAGDVDIIPIDGGRGGYNIRLKDGRFVQDGDTNMVVGKKPEDLETAGDLMSGGGRRAFTETKRKGEKENESAFKSFSSSVTENLTMDDGLLSKEVMSSFDPNSNKDRVKISNRVRTAVVHQKMVEGLTKADADAYYENLTDAQVDMLETGPRDKFTKEENPMKLKPWIKNQPGYK